MMNKIDYAAIYHRAGLEFRYFQDGELHIRLMAKKGDLDRVVYLYDDKYVMGKRDPLSELVMEKVACDGVHDYFEVAYLPQDPRIHYLFRLEKGEETAWLYQSGVESSLRPGLDEAFAFACILGCDDHIVPQWSRGAVVYQIFVDRFNRVGELEPGMDPWGTAPTRGNYCGGNLRGILEKVDYIKELGADVVYLTPIFEAGSNHRYDTIDYLRIDPMIGTLDDLRALADALHARGMYLMLDGVFNHSSPKFAPFADLRANGADSQYKDWFLYSSLPIDMLNKNFDSFSHGAGMPKLNMANPDAREYFCNVGRYWIQEGHIDGWRLDVANEIDYDFLRMFRRAVKEAKEDAAVIGESWVDTFQYLQGDMFDGVMHYPMTFAIRNFFEEGSARSPQQLADNIQKVHMMYTYGVQQGSWVMLDSHDTSRLITICCGDRDKMMAAAFLQFLVPGAPFVYYGDEVALPGADDPDCRRCMPWDAVQRGDTMMGYYKKLCAIKRRPAGRTGALRDMRVDDGVLMFTLAHPQGDMLCVLNISGEERIFRDEWMKSTGFDAQAELLWGINWKMDWILNNNQGAVFANPQRPGNGKEPLRGADFRQPFPEKYALMMREFMRNELGQEVDI